MSAQEPLPAFSGYGIEIEYMIVDRHSLGVRPIADELMRAAAGRHVGEIERDSMGWSKELALHVLEIKNRQPQASLSRLAAAFQSEVRMINSLLQSENAQLMPGGMHPWMDPRRETLMWTRQPAAIYRSYDRIFDCRRHGWANIQSVHLNLPFADDEEFARLHAAVRLALPILPALAASSPYAEGRYSGYLDYRMEVYRTHQMQIPSSMGQLVPDDSSSRADYQERVLLPMYREIAKHDIEGVLRHEWLNARAAIPRFDRDAIEIRVLDVQECPQADLAVAAAVAALVRRLFHSAPPPRSAEGRISTAALLGILRACIRDGEQARIDEPRYLALVGGKPKPCTARDLWSRLVYGMGEGGELDPEFAAPLHLILERGPLARRLLAALGPEPSAKRLQAVYGELCTCLEEGRLYSAND